MHDDDCCDGAVAEIDYRHRARTALIHAAIRIWARAIGTIKISRFDGIPASTPPLSGSLFGPVFSETASVEAVKSSEPKSFARFARLVTI